MNSNITKLPISTYRVQFNRTFRLKDAVKLVPYLANLGISHLYASPLLKARPGSMHGYDCVDPTRLNPELGTEADLKRLVQTLKEHRMGLLLDIVPNHMGIAGGANPWWEDVRKRKQASSYARVFDIDWTASSGRLVYRRFFDIDGLAGVRVEDPFVFSKVHQKLFDWIRKDWVRALRVDHPDGLADPAKYLSDLRRRSPRKLYYIVVEKILSGGEELVPWPAQGTTGYEFLNALGRLFVDPKGYRQIRTFYRAWTGCSVGSEAMLLNAKRGVLEGSLSPELERLTSKLSVQNGSERVLLRNALKEVLAAFPVYRTYRSSGQGRHSDLDARIIRKAVRRAAGDKPHLGLSIRRVGEALLAKNPAFALRFQQLSGPVMAKGLEDTAFYRYYPLLSLNEVGGEPDFDCTSDEEFRSFITRRLKKWPAAMSATSTHDTKRSEDARARIHVLSYMPKRWIEAVRRWSRWNAPFRAMVGGQSVPDANEEYLLYQTLVGIWPLAPESAAGRKDLLRRVQQCMQKSLREAKVHSNWANPDRSYEAGFEHFIHNMLVSKRAMRFRKDFRRFHNRVAAAGAAAALSQTLLKIVLPGVPDFYQGSELWDFSLVDPDNRRPVDFKKRAVSLRSLLKKSGSGTAVLSRKLLLNWNNGLIKLFVIQRALRLRRQRGELFEKGRYVRLRVTGPKRNHLFACARAKGREFAICIVPRFSSGSASRPRLVPARSFWAGTRVCLPPGAPERLVCAFTGQVLSANKRGDICYIDTARLLGPWPVALLHSTGC